MKQRVIAAGVVLLLWVGGLGLLIRRAYFLPDVARFAEAGLRVAPASVYYGVESRGQSIGFASSTIDTSTTSLSLDEMLMADAPVPGTTVPRRTTLSTHIEMSRALRVKHFELRVMGDSAADVSGHVLGDTLLQLAISSTGAPTRTRRVTLDGPILLPSMVPLAIGLGEKPSVGSDYVLPIFDPATLSREDVRFSIAAESLFVVNDSAVYDSSSGRWHGVQPDTVKAWKVAAPRVFSGWIDEDGRVLQTTRRGFHVVRLPYEVAFYDWRGSATVPPMQLAPPSRRARRPRTASRR